MKKENLDNLALKYNPMVLKLLLCHKFNFFTSIAVDLTALFEKRGKYV